MNGFLLIDKESGINSFKLVIALRKLTGQKRVGFAGTLDPLASGLMILALGEYTKLLPYLEAEDKVYQVRVRLGQISDSYDVDGEVTEISVEKEPELELIENVLKTDFSGKISQVPPRFSAIKIDGKRAYDMARKGQQFELKGRSVQIFSSKVLGYKYPDLDLEVHCSSGTYIRSLAHDLGQKLGCGGVVSRLRRIRIGDVSVEAAASLESIKSDDLSKFFVQPEELLKSMGTILLLPEQYEILARGNFIENTSQLKNETLGIFKGQVVGVVETTDSGQKLKFKKKLHIV